MSNTQLILHVKGTESETTSLPRHEVQAALSEGRITDSQLIWSPSDNAWRPARDYPGLQPIEKLILHVKGTESETQEVPRKAVRTAIARGQITHSQLIWSAKDNAWKQVRELPELLPSQKLAPPPIRPNFTAPVARAADAIIPESPANPVARAIAASGAPTPHVRVAAAGAAPQPRIASATPVPKVRVAAAATPVPKATGVTLVRTTGDLTVKEEESESHPFKWIFIGLAVLILAVLGANYLLVDQPLNANLSHTPFGGTKVYAHFGAFLQPNVIMIHVPPSAAVTSDKLVDFLVTLSQSTPDSPVGNNLFARVAFTTGWTAQYSISGFGWKQLGDMRQESASERKDFLLDQLCDAHGIPLLPPSTLSDSAREDQREKVWNDFVAYFTTQR